MDRFHEFLKHPNVVEVAPDPRIIALPTNIRNHYVKKKEAGEDDQGAYNARCDSLGHCDPPSSRGRYATGIVDLSTG